MDVALGVSVSPRFSATQLTFEEQDARFGVDLEYDIVSGLLSELHQDAGYARVSVEDQLLSGSGGE